MEEVPWFILEILNTIGSEVIKHYGGIQLQVLWLSMLGNFLDLMKHYRFKKRIFFLGTISSF